MSKLLIQQIFYLHYYHNFFFWHVEMWNIFEHVFR